VEVIKIMEGEVQNETETQPEKTENINQETQKTGNKSMKLGIIVLAIVILAVAVYLAMSKKNVATNVTNETVIQETPAITGSGVNESTVSPTGATVKNIVVEGSEYSYNPSLINLAVGDTVSLTFKNVGTLPHNLMIKELGVATKTVAPGASDVVEFTVNQTGTFAFYCSIGTHRAQGMEGKMVVNDKPVD
jgi:plastocyanin